MITGKRKQVPLASYAQMDYIVKLKIATQDNEEIPIPLLIDKATEMINRLRSLRYIQRQARESEFYESLDWEDAENESSWSYHIWGC